ncbi:DUF305 domain-containing protein [Aeromicrobium tamlense]|uniref:DUF305 domain-containing protein n=1 Tax=Aeromicrobium tamlense TaxID=375541 RepID=A0A8I0FS21_9ACTN|nr:DUF305 domain-containing protein [Aeromicrobium tamlense]MBD1268652.1 DUF305 domain-containing protein [Aeromicrobium tamlense]NYI37441.1 uncharacterized protein (DUF305 family) [Aeromicrobium tamlense]
MRRRTAAPAALALLAALTLGGCSDDAREPGADHRGHGSADAQTERADANEADVMFATMMIPHHEQAIEMSDLILAKDGIDPRVRALAEEIKQAQAPEIEQLRGWLADWDAPTADASHGGGHGAGMMDEQDMAALEDAEGDRASRLFLEQMIEHHEGAIDMARSEVADGRHPDAVGLAGSIVATQLLEIERMNDLLEQS